MIEDPAPIASELRNLSARPDPGRAGPVKKLGPSPARPAFGRARLKFLLYNSSNSKYNFNNFYLNPSIL